MSSQDLHLIEMLNPYQAEIQNYIDDYQCVSEIRTRDYDPTRGAIKKKCHKLWKKYIIFLIPPPPLGNLDYFEFGKKIIFYDPPPLDQNWEKI